MDRQIFLPTTMNFNLCNPKSLNPTIVYAVMYFQGKQYKVNTGVKVYPAQWNKKKQCAIVSNCLSALDNFNNKLTNKKIREIIMEFQSFLTYLCDNPNEITNIYNVLKTYVNKDMGTRQTSRKESFEMQFRKLVNEFSKDRENKYKSIIDGIISYMKEESIALEWESINQSMLKDFVCYMINKSPKPMQIKYYNEKINNLYFVLNHADAKDYLTKYNVKKWKKTLDTLTDNRDEEERQSTNIVLTEDEINKLYQHDFGNPVRNEVRDLFVFSCLTGLSECDLLQIWNEKYISWIDDNNIQIRRSKTNKTAMIPIHDYRVKEIYERYRNGFTHTKLKGGNEDEKLKLRTNKNNLLNDNLRQMIKEVGFDRDVPVTRSYVRCEGSRITVENKRVMRKMSDEITFYDGRHTFITMAYYQGMPIEQVADIAGHSSVMAKKVYLKLDMEKEAKAKAKRNNEFYKKNEIAKSQEPQQEQVVPAIFNSTIAVEYIERNAVQRKELYDTINKQKEELQQQKQEANAMRKQLKMANKVLNDYEEVFSVGEYTDRFADMVLEKEED